MADINADSILESLGLQRQGSADLVVPLAGAFILGGLIGAGVALLFAPKSGEDLRGELAQRVDEALESTEKLVKGETRKTEPSTSVGINAPGRRSGF